MKSSQFCYWLQGFFEISNAGGQPVSLNPDQIKVVQGHLAMVFHHELDPEHGDANEQKILQAMHDGLTEQLGKKDPDGKVYRC